MYCTQDEFGNIVVYRDKKVSQDDIKQMMIDNTRHLTSHLPASIAQITAVIGLEMAMQLVAYFGGIELCVPVKAQGAVFDDLVFVLGKSAAYQFWQAFKGEKLYISRCDLLRRKLRDHAFIHQLLVRMEQGVSQTQAIKELAIAFDISERYGYEILKRTDSHSSNDWQPNLF